VGSAASRRNSAAPLRLHIEAWEKPSMRKIEKAVEILHAGGVAAYPTDSVYALGCAYEAHDAIERIYQAKAMHKSQRLALICPDLSTASKFGQLSQSAFRLAQRIFPGPYTLVVPARRDVPRGLTDAKRRTVGLRITSHPIAQALALALGRPLLTTSAIAPGGEHEPCRDADEILAAFGRCVDVVIDSEMTAAQPSTVLEIDEHDAITVIREGAGSVDGIL
jgi:tRNA threonylcarbamoyl adenosine modification protein (Sua5/YciO/YrdC/YwlC family)